MWSRNFQKGGVGVEILNSGWGGGSLGSIFGMSRARVILVLRECIWNAPAVSLVLPVFDDTGSLGSPPRQLVSPRV